MRKSTFSTSQKLSILAEHDAGVSEDDLSRKHQISPATSYKWKKEHEENQDEDKLRIKELEAMRCEVYVNRAVSWAFAVRRIGTA